MIKKQVLRSPWLSQLILNHIGGGGKLGYINVIMCIYIYINHFSQLGETIRLFLEEQISLSYSVPTRGKDQQKNK